MKNPLNPDEDYNLPKGNSNYLKFEEGPTEFLPLASAIVGWEYWNNEGKPVRLQDEPEDPHTLTDIRFRDGKPEIRHFWAFPVWDFGSNAVKVLQITQKGIMKAILGYTRNDKWGSPIMTYSLTVNREGEGLATEYTVMANPAQKLPEAIPEAWETVQARGFDINRVFDAGDPFTDPNKANDTN